MRENIAMNRSQQTLLLTALAAGLAIGVLGKVHAEATRSPAVVDHPRARELVFAPAGQVPLASDSGAGFHFSLGAGDTMTVAVSANAASGGALRLNVAVVNLSTGARVFDFQSEPKAGSGAYDPGQLLFAATTDMLEVAERYRLTVGQPAIRDEAAPTPEPGTLAVCAFGLLTLSWLRRRRLRATLSSGNF